MAHKATGKLVRDLIPNIIRTHGEVPKIKILSQQAYKEALRIKLVEEAMECQNAKDRSSLIEECADIEEVLHALYDAHHITRRDISAVAKKKRMMRGAFKKRIFLIGTN